MRHSVIAALLLTLLAGVNAHALKTETFLTHRGVGTAATTSSTLVTSGQAIIRLSSGTAASSLDALLLPLGAARGVELGGGWILITWNDGASVTSKLPFLLALPGVSAIQPSHVYSVNRVPTDPLVNSQYALFRVDAFRAWEFETGFSSRVTIGIVDSGIDGSHPDLSAKLSNTNSVAFDPNTGLVASPNDPLVPACQHGTEVAGVAAASSDNGIAVAGMSWGAQLVSLKVFLDSDCTPDCGDSGLGGGCVTNDPAMISAINFATGVVNTPKYGKMVVNMSLGCAPGAPPCAVCTGSALETATVNAFNAGVVIVAAAGNSGGAVNNPGDCLDVIPAGATDSNDNVPSFSSRGAELAASGLVAPGVSVLTTAPGSKTSSPSGTSFASPMVAGAAAVLLSAKPTLTPAQVQTNLRAGADNLGLASTIQGAGRLNLYKSVYLTLHGGSLPAVNDVNAAAKAFAYPNPVNLSKTGGVVFSLPPAINGAITDLKIYTLDGQFVRDLTAPIWDGKNTEGNKVATGTYMFVVKTSKGAASGRMTVIR